MSSPRAQPFFCPYCGENDFVPFGEKPNGFRCESCERCYTVTLLGLAAPKREPDPSRAETG